MEPRFLHGFLQQQFNLRMIEPGKRQLDIDEELSFHAAPEMRISCSRNNARERERGCALRLIIISPIISPVNISDVNYAMFYIRPRGTSVSGQQPPITRWPRRITSFRPLLLSFPLPRQLLRLHEAAACVTLIHPTSDSDTKTINFPPSFSETRVSRFASVASSLILKNVTKWDLTRRPMERSEIRKMKNATADSFARAPGKGRRLEINEKQRVTGGKNTPVAGAA